MLLKFDIDFGIYFIIILKWLPAVVLLAVWHLKFCLINYRALFELISLWIKLLNVSSSKQIGEIDFDKDNTMLCFTIIVKKCWSM